MDTREVIIIGAGPAGLAAAVYAAREDLNPLVIESGVVGGMAALTATIDNYPGFAEGVGGLELSDRLAAHAKRFGAEILTGVTVTGLARDGDRVRVDTKHEPLYARAVLVATGSTYRRLEVPGEAELIGRGVHFCATCDGPVYRGRELFVIGGGNSAMQETLFLAKFASRITMLVYRPELKGTAILRDQVNALPNVEVVYNTSVTALAASDNRINITASGLGDQPATYTTDGVFVLIGLRANTQPFAGALELDERQFIVTKPGLITSMPGVFAAGDVRSGSTWQIASAIGEGVDAALSIRGYLDTQSKPHQAG